MDDLMKPTLYAIARRLPAATAAGLALVLSATACRESTASPASAPVPTNRVTRPSTSAPTPHTPLPTQPRSTPTPALYSLTVVNSFVRRPGDYLWIEGVVPEIVLKSSDGTRLTKIGRFEADVVFDDLKPGRYAVRRGASLLRHLRPPRRPYRRMRNGHRHTRDYPAHR
jgi:hypothetical protein